MRMIMLGKCLSSRAANATAIMSTERLPFFTEVM